MPKKTEIINYCPEPFSIIEVVISLNCGNGEK